MLRFAPEHGFDVHGVADLENLERACDPQRKSENLFYAMRLDGIFKTMHTRAVHPSAQGGGGLEDAAKQQAEFHFTDVEGTLVGLWSPVYARAFNIPKYHFHFLSRDRTQGGHVMDCAADSLRAGLQTLFEYHVRLPETGAFLTSDLTKDPAEALRKAE